MEAEVFFVFLFFPDVGGKVIHLVERAPPPPSQGGPGSVGPSADSGPSSSSQGTSQVPHDRNANSYVMLGTFNLPVNIMDPQQIQVSLRLVGGARWIHPVHVYVHKIG